MNRALKSVVAGAALLTGLVLPTGVADASTQPSSAPHRADPVYCPYSPNTHSRLFASNSDKSRVIRTYPSGSRFMIVTPFPEVGGPGGPFVHYSTGYLRSHLIHRVAGACAT